MKEEETTSDLVVIEQEKSAIESIVESTVVTNDEELRTVADHVKNIKEVAKRITTLRDEFIRPANEIKDQAKRIYDPAIQVCKNAELTLKQRAEVYMTEVKRKQRLDQERLADRVERGTMTAETAVRKIEAMEPVKPTVKTDTSALRMGEKAVAEIVDRELIPDEYWVIDEVAVRKAALERHKTGVQQIPGVVITMKAVMSSY